jgi:hypothetical protein
MRRTCVLFAALVAVATAAGGASSGLGIQSAPARIRLLDTDPVTVRGAGFRPYEHARLTAIQSGDRLVRRATAGPGGGFTLRLPGLDVNACAGFSITVAGDEGSRATYKRAPGVCPLP